MPLLVHALLDLGVSRTALVEHVVGEGAHRVGPEGVKCLWVSYSSVLSKFASHHRAKPDALGAISCDVPHQPQAVPKELRSQSKAIYWLQISIGRKQSTINHFKFTKRLIRRNTVNDQRYHLRISCNRVPLGLNLVSMSPYVLT